MATKSAWDSHEAARQKYYDFRKAHPKTDFEFLDQKSRSRRVCRSPDQLKYFLLGLLKLADEAVASKQVVHIVLDTEGDCLKPLEPCHKKNHKPKYHHWHKYFLRLHGTPEEEIRRREQFQLKQDKEFAEIKNPKTRQKLRASFRKRSKEEGLIRSDCFAFQMACVEDAEDKFAFAACPIRIMGHGKGMPPELERLLNHPGKRIVNVGAPWDLRQLSASFFDDRLSNIEYIELPDIVALKYGFPLPKHPDIHGNGVLGLFELVFREQNLTWDKDPNLTRSHWWRSKWGDPEIDYLLKDVVSVAMTVREVAKTRDLSLAPVLLFQEVPVPPPVPEATSPPAAGHKRRHRGGTFSKWQYDDTSDSSESEGEFLQDISSDHIPDHSQSTVADGALIATVPTVTTPPLSELTYEEIHSEVKKLLAEDLSVPCSSSSLDVQSAVVKPDCELNIAPKPVEVVFCQVMRRNWEMMRSSMTTQNTSSMWKS